jgi:hypothetical protein
MDLFPRLSPGVFYLGVSKIRHNTLKIFIVVVGGVFLALGFEGALLVLGF